MPAKIKGRPRSKSGLKTKKKKRRNPNEELPYVNNVPKYVDPLEAAPTAILEIMLVDNVCDIYSLQASNSRKNCQNEGLQEG